MNETNINSNEKIKNINSLAKYAKNQIIVTIIQFLLVVALIIFVALYTSKMYEYNNQNYYSYYYYYNNSQDLINTINTYDVLVVIFAILVAIIALIDFILKIFIAIKCFSCSDYINPDFKIFSIISFFIPLVGFILSIIILRGKNKYIKKINDNENMYQNNNESLNLNASNVSTVENTIDKTTKNNSKVNSINDLETKLASLKKLFNDGTLSKEEYDELKSKIISSI